MRSERMQASALLRTSTSRDALIAGVCLAATLVAVVVAEEPGAREPDALATVLLMAAIVPLMWRRRWPVAVASTTVLMTFAYMLLSYPGGPSTLPVLVALYTVAAAGHRSWAMAIVVLFAGAGVGYRALVENDPPVSIVISAALYVLVLFLGDVVHSRQALRTEIAQRLRAAAARRETEAKRRVAEERLHIARDVHDVVAHTLTAVGVQASVVDDLFDDDPARARAELAALRSACNDAVAELHTALGPLRDVPASVLGHSTPHLASLADLGQRLSTDDLIVEVTLEEGVETLTNEKVQIAAYRIAQEALTNVIRHSGADRTSVQVQVRGSTLWVSIEDDGVGPTTDCLDGFGLIGMRERADAVGGVLDAGLSANGGFRVEARLPVDGGER